MDQVISLVWRYLTIQDIYELLKTNKHSYSIFQNSATWVYLLKRDFQIEYYKSNPTVRYISEYVERKINNLKLYVFRPNRLDPNYFLTNDVCRVIKHVYSYDIDPKEYKFDEIVRDLHIYRLPLSILRP